jgi:AcrR family transcriptional regulator
MKTTTSGEKVHKADLTRQKILDVSLTLFQKQGYEKATMRAIAKAAGLAPGAAYYHFETKEHIIFDFYQRSFDDHLPGVEKVLSSEKDLRKRLAGVVRVHMEVARPYHEISKVLFQTAVNPDHPLSPFSKESGPLREKNIDIFRQVIEGSTTSVPEKLKGKLPEILWLYKMGIILYWIYDRTPDQRKTFQFIEESSGLIAKLLALSRLPGIQGFSEKVLAMFFKYKTY